MIELTEAELAQIKKNIQPIYDEFKDQIDPVFLQLIRDTQN